MPNTAAQPSACPRSPAGYAARMGPSPVSEAYRCFSADLVYEESVLHPYRAQGIKSWTAVGRVMHLYSLSLYAASMDASVSLSIGGQQYTQSNAGDLCN